MSLTSLYESLKRSWISRHPDATPQEYERAIAKIAKEIGY